MNQTFTAADMQQARAEGFILGGRNFAADIIKAWAADEKANGSDLLHDRLICTLLAQVLHTETEVTEIADSLTEMTKEYYIDAIKHSKERTLKKVLAAMAGGMQGEELKVFIENMMNID